MISQYEVPAVLRNSMPGSASEFYPVSGSADIFKSVQHSPIVKMKVMEPEDSPGMKKTSR